MPVGMCLQTFASEVCEKANVEVKGIGCGNPTAKHIRFVVQGMWVRSEVHPFCVDAVARRLVEIVSVSLSCGVSPDDSEYVFKR